MSDITKTRYTEEYKKYRREYMKAYRNRNKTLNDTPHNPLWKKKGKRIFSDNTKKQYIKTILRIHQKLQVNTHRDLEVTLDGLFSNKPITDDITKYIKKQLSYIFNLNFTTTMKEMYPKTYTISEFSSDTNLQEVSVTMVYKYFDITFDPSASVDSPPLSGIDFPDFGGGTAFA